MNRDKEPLKHFGCGNQLDGHMIQAALPENHNADLLYLPHEQNHTHDCSLLLLQEDGCLLS